MLRAEVGRERDDTGIVRGRCRHSQIHVPGRSAKVDHQEAVVPRFHVRSLAVEELGIGHDHRDARAKTAIALVTREITPAWVTSRQPMLRGVEVVRHRDRDEPDPRKACCPLAGVNLQRLQLVVAQDLADAQAGVELPCTDGNDFPGMVLHEAEMRPRRPRDDGDDLVDRERLVEVRARGRGVAATAPLALSAAADKNVAVRVHVRKGLPDRNPPRS